MQREIPLGSGLAVWITVVAQAMLVSMSDESAQGAFSYDALALASTLVFFAGWLDDTAGDTTVKGLQGHWQMLRDQRSFTTGSLKVLIIAGAAIWMSVLLWHHQTWTGIGTMLASSYAAATGILLMTLSSNTINLLDLRPGRALKGFLLLCLLALFGAYTQGHLQPSLSILLPVIVPVLLLFRQDVQARSMLGDCGANLLGFTVGFALSAYGPLVLQSLVMLSLLALHVLAERASLSVLIERVSFLHWMDGIGRADRQKLS